MREPGDMTFAKRYPSLIASFDFAETEAALERALGISEAAPKTEQQLSELAAAIPSRPVYRRAARCYIPDWIEEEKAWGVACQLYELRSPRNAGIGDFEDLAILAEMVAAAGADFLGVTPLHALFLA